jgi:hypothetical protein
MIEARGWSDGDWEIRDYGGLVAWCFGALNVTLLGWRLGSIMN